MDEERRKRTRVHTHRTVDFLAANGESVAIETENVSLKGLLALPNSRVTTGATGLIRITLATDVVIEAECRVIRSDGQGIAIQFLGMEPQSFLHLRNLVRYNAEDADRIDQELTAPRFD